MYAMLDGRQFTKSHWFMLEIRRFFPEYATLGHSKIIEVVPRFGVMYFPWNSMVMMIQFQLQN